MNQSHTYTSRYSVEFSDSLVRVCQIVTSKPTPVLGMLFIKYAILALGGKINFDNMYVTYMPYDTVSKYAISSANILHRLVALLPLLLIIGHGRNL